MQGTLPGLLGDILLDAFDPAALAREIVSLADDPDRLSRLGARARERIATLCEGHARAAELLAVWQRIGGDARTA